MRDFRFSCNIFGVPERDAFVAGAGEAERRGYDTVFAPDHLGAPAPFPVAETIETLERLFAAEEQQGLPGGRTPRPVQKRGFGSSGPPLIVGGTGDRTLEIAARYADVVAIAGAYQVKGQPPGTLRLGAAAEADDRVHCSSVKRPWMIL